VDPEGHEILVHEQGGVGKGSSLEGVDRCPAPLDSDDAPMGLPSFERNVHVASSRTSKAIAVEVAAQAPKNKHAKWKNKRTNLNDNIY
jgi:hypothetical protein